MFGKIYEHLVEPKLQLAAASAAAGREGLSVFQVVGSNMAPTLEPNEIVWHTSEYRLERGQVVGFTIAEFKGVAVPSRVIGLAGEAIELRRGDLLVNDVRVPEPYLQAERAEQKYSRSLRRQVVPEATVWLMGDFRDMSKDSRNFGALPVASLLGRIVKAHAPGGHAQPRIVR